MSHYIEYEDWTFPVDKIKEGNIHLAASLLSSSLEVNSFLATVECDDPSILDFKRNSKLMYYSAPGRGMVWRVQSIERTAPSLYRISATSTLGLLTEGQHYGGMYSEYGGISHGETAEEVIKDICGSVPISISDDLKGIKIYGWLPIAAPRDNLAQVLFAIGGALRSETDGSLRVEPLQNTGNWSIGANRIYADGKVNYAASVTSVIVLEHQYVRGSETRELYSGESSEGDVITFSEPMHTLTAEGFTILESGTNWAKLSSGSGTLSGHTYIHTTREVEQKVADGAEPNIKTVKDATLVCVANSNSVAKRLAGFYRCRETIDAPVKYQGETPGQKLEVFHPFDHISVDAFLQSADITLSNVLKAQEKCLVGFVPEIMEYYDTRVVFLENGTWTVPNGVVSIRVVIVGGGQGGASGCEGESGKVGGAGGAGGVGGTGGEGGSGGKFFRIDLKVTPGDRYPITIGAGGVGGTYSSKGSVPGSLGAASTFGDYSSDSGITSQTGFADTTTGEQFAMKGEAGIRGGNGGSGKKVNSTTPGGSPGEDVLSYKGGAAGEGDGLPYFGVFGNGGGGGGAAVGQRGEKGTGGYATWSLKEGSLDYASAKGGDGGLGGSATAPATAYIQGQGGQGGNGGGGGGGGGVAEGAKGTGKNTHGYAGDGGAGSRGGDAASGIVIIYYKKP